MNHKKSQVGSSSSLTSQLFGSQESSSSNDVLSSIFPPSKGTGSWQNEPSGNQSWNNRKDSPYIHRDATYGSSAGKERNSIYQQVGGEPCHLSSSLYYGGRDGYSKSNTSQSSTSYPTFKKDGGEDDPSGASRGNWWQGSLYY